MKKNNYEPNADGNIIIHVEKLDPDFWGNETMRNIDNQHIYKLVDGRWHSVIPRTDEDGEPNSPLRRNVILEEVKVTISEG